MEDKKRARSGFDDIKLARKAGKKGGKASSKELGNAGGFAKLTKKQRVEAARMGANARWDRERTKKRLAKEAKE